MKKRLLTALLALCIALSLLPLPGLAADITVTEIVPCKYNHIYPFSDGLARVSTRSGGYYSYEWSYKYGFIDKTGREVIPCQCEWYGDFSDGLASMGKKIGENKYGTAILKYGFVNKTGNEVIPFKYDSVGDFSEGLAPVAVIVGGDDYNGYILKWGFVDKSGNEVVPLKYDYAEEFSEGLAWVFIGDSRGFGKWGLIDATGKEVVPCIFDGDTTNADKPHSFPFSEGLAPVTVNRGLYGYIDKTGSFVIPAKYDRASSFSEGLAVVVTGGYFGKVGMIDKAGREVIPCQYESAGSFSEGLAKVELSGKWGFIDKTGREVIPCKYESAGSFSEGLAPVKLNGKWKFIDKTGREIAALKYNYVGDISDGFAQVSLNGQGLISVSGMGEDISTITINGKSIQSLFSKSSFEYSNDLALFAANLSANVEDETGDRIKDYYRSLEWPDADWDIYQYGGDRAYSIACAKLSRDENLLVITARGSQTFWEFFEDGLSFGKRDFFGYETNDVIYDFDRDIMTGLNQFLANHKYLEEKPLKVLITGHSLGGAAANLNAARFTLFKDYGAWWTDLTEQSDIYCYTFGAINSLSDNSTVEKGFENIHNIYNLEDSFGPNRWGDKLPSGLGRGYGKFGHMDEYSHDYEGGADDQYYLFVNITNHLIEQYIDSLMEGYVSCRLNSPFEPKPGQIPFDDVEAGKWYYDAVYWAIQNGVTNGTGAGTFSPDQDCTEIQILTFLWRAAGKPATDAALPVTVTGVADYVSAAKWAFSKGMIDGTFKQDTPCTRARAVMLMWQAAGSPAASGSGFTDVPANAGYAQAVSWAVGEGVTNGTGGNMFSPGGICSRGHIVTFLYRDRG